MSWALVLGTAGIALALFRVGGLFRNKDGVDAEFFPDGRFTSLLVVNLGHPGENPWFDRLPRLQHDDAVSYA